MCMSVNCPNNHTGVGTDNLCHCEPEEKDYVFTGELTERTDVSLYVTAVSEEAARKQIATGDFDWNSCVKYGNIKESDFSTLTLTK